MPELIRFCHEAHIDEVLLSEESYEIATVVQNEAYFHRVADAYCEIVPLLKAEGLIPSVYIYRLHGCLDGRLETVFQPSRRSSAWSTCRAICSIPCTSGCPFCLLMSRSRSAGTP